jgi:hypothetical protein
MDNAGEASAAPDAVAGRDLGRLGWWVLERLADGSMEPRRAGVFASMMRVVAAMGPDGATREEQLRETALRGVLMHGIPPRDAEEWALAERIFTADAIEEFHRWTPLGVADPDDDYEGPWGYERPERRGRQRMFAAPRGGREVGGNLRRDVCGRWTGKAGTEAAEP